MARSASTDIFTDSVAETARRDLPQSNKPSKRARVIRVYVWIAMFLFPVAVLADILLVVKSAPTTTSPSNGSALTATSSPGRTAATRELMKWLKGVPAPLPGGVMLSWDKAENPPIPATDQGPNGTKAPTYRTEIDYFTLLDGKGTAYTAAVQVALDPRGGGAMALSGPSLIVTVPAAGDAWASGSPWPGLASSSTTPAAVSAAITGWANAYTSGSADSLRLAVGDTNPDHSYLPLSGISAVTPTPIAVATPGSPGTMIARVSLAIRWDGQRADPQPQSGDESPLTTMDLLIERADTAAPVVTAWGAPGSGTTLRDYANAVTATGLTLPSSRPK